MISIDNKNLYSRFFHFPKLFSQKFMIYFFAVFSKVPGNKNIAYPAFHNGLQGRIQNSLTLHKHFSVAVQILCQSRTIAGITSQNRRIIKMSIRNSRNLYAFIHNFISVTFLLTGANQRQGCTNRKNKPVFFHFKIILQIKSKKRIKSKC